MTDTLGRLAGTPGGFRHQAFFYDGIRQFVRGVSSFVRAGLDAGEPVLVVVDGPKIDALRTALGRDYGKVQFADMGQVGANPARIIPAWADFVAAHGGDGQRVRGVDEPIGPDRDAPALVECQRHEALLNVAFAESGDWTLLCPYDTRALPAGVIETARHTHPLVAGPGGEEQSDEYEGAEVLAAPFADPLPDPAGDEVVEVRFDRDSSTGSIRDMVAIRAADAGLDIDATDDVMLAVSELLSNSLRHAGGGGVLRVWTEEARFCFEVQDRGRLLEPLAGRTRPSRYGNGGRGLWLVNHLCDLVQVRTVPEGTVVRVHMRRPPAG